MAFVGIEFSEESGAGVFELVHSSWLTPKKQEVWWPPLKHREAFDKALRKGDLPEEETWSIYKIKRCFFKEDDFFKVKEKCKKCEFTSDIQSEQEELEVEKKKRRLNAKRNFSSSDEEDCRNSSKLPMPPRIRDVSTVLNNSGINIIPLSSPVSTSSPVFLKSTCASNSSRLSQSFSCTSTPSTSKTDKGDINGDAQFGFSTPTLTKSSSESKVSNLTDLRRLEEYLSNNTNLSAVASYLSGLGGRDPTTKTNAVLRKLMTNEFAMKFSFLGIRQKKGAFVELNARKVLIRAIQLVCKEITESNIDKFTKDWLKHAPKRFESEIKRKHAQKHQD
ncbi:hypothetical protein RN001_014886 [Aquatica leii]|uniref:DUF4806 domain-containing protein n=1 Tax=Aquatica leii TaxID=1421715 RepID=A0AAN7PPX9_9COLE|nr:hypothetical protein RN001_014886 [Aquatica leii]